MRRTTRVIVQGYAGSFHDEVARMYFGNNRIEIIPASSFQILADQLRTDASIHYAVMAIENSIAGSILQNYRHLRENNFWISGEVYHRIRHQLLALPGQKVEDIKCVQSHPMALYQCTDFFAKHPHLTLSEAEDTALSAKLVKDQQLVGTAAVASHLAGEIYGLENIAPNIESSSVNYTRFVIISRDPQYGSMGSADKASIYLRVPHDKGSLLKALQCIADHDINLSKVQSFPVLGELNTYYFHMDLEFEHKDQYEGCIEELKNCTTALEELGVYKKGNVEI